MSENVILRADGWWYDALTGERIGKARLGNENVKRRTIISKVAGVTYDGRQDIIAKLRGDEPCRIVPEPTNKYDPNALAVHVAIAPGEIAHVGFIPRELAAQIAPHLEGEAFMVRLLEITGGFETFEGDTSALGLRIEIDLPQ